MNAEIIKIELVKTKKGVNSVKVIVKCDDGVYANSYIMETAPDNYSTDWWSLIDQAHGWKYFPSSHSFQLIGLRVNVECEESKFGRQVNKVMGLATETPPPPPETISPTTQVPEDDDIPF